MTDRVLISGGGPAGLMLAGELALAGVNSVVLERRAEPATASPGMAVHGRALELLKRRALPEPIGPNDAFPWPLTPFALLWLNMEGAREVDYTYALPQWRTERLLEAWVKSLGVDVRRGHELISFTRNADGITAQVQDERGVSYELTAGWLAGCDGAASRVRELAGIDFKEIAPTYYGVLGDFKPAEGEDRTFDAGLKANGMFGAIPLDAETVRLMTIEFDVEAPAADTPVTKAELTARIERITGAAPTIGEPTYLARFGAPTGLAAAFRDGRVLLVGDAAHSWFISGTQGLNAALQDAANLGWKLAAAIRGTAPEDLLDTYDAERRPVAEAACHHADSTMALLYPLERVEKLRNLITTLMGFDQVNRYLLEMPTAARYPLPASAPDGDGSHPLLGTAAPDAALEPIDAAATAAAATTATTVSEAMRSGHGLLLDLSGGTAELDAATGWSDRVDVVRAKPQPDLPAAVLLLRPDGRIAYADDAGTDAAALTASLRTWFGESIAAG
ncbi:MAG TPA: FAD-dependent monooxygenase [Actinocrinis sp.]|jgi:2-polyprenyl-6-methoxyphenol hydroxylase-like FAD-dependent oxidoreductase